MNLIEKLCPFCEQFFDQESIKDHIALEHLNLESGQFIAESLVEETTPVSPQELEDNDEIAPLDFKHTCKVCQKQFISERSFNLHTKFVHSKPKEDNVEEVEELDDEVEEVDQVVNDNECKKCNKTFSRKYILKRHLREVHEEKKFHCNRCDQRFVRKFDFLKHMERFHAKKPTADDIVKCQNRQKDKLRRYVSEVHDQENSFQCKRCNKTLSSKSILRRHVREVHDQEGIVQRKKCNKTFSSKSRLQRHVREVHDQETIFECKKCNQTLSSKRALQRHVKEVHEQKSIVQCKSYDFLVVPIELFLLREG